MRRILNAFINWFENGELAPFIILISVPHYAAVLSKFDWGPVGAVLGFLIDLVHYRTIRAFQRGYGKTWMMVLTSFSFGFHFAFYWIGGAGWAALFFGAAVPVVIFALSFLSYAERWSQKAAKAAQENVSVSHRAADALPDAAHPGLPEAHPARICGECGASCKSQNAYAAHMRWKHPAHAEVTHDT
jgi:hypothetical protein